MALAEKTSVYTDIAVDGLMAGCKLDGIASEDYTEIGGDSIQGKYCVFTITDPIAGDVTTVDPATGAQVLSVPSQRTVSVPLEMYGNTGMIISGAHKLYGTLKPEKAMEKFVKSVIRGCNKTRNSLVLAALNLVPANDTAFTGPDNVSYQAVTNKLAYFGTALSGSETDRASITASHKFGDDTTYMSPNTMLKMMKQILREHGAITDDDTDRRFVAESGNRYIALYCHSKVMQAIELDKNIALDRREVFRDSLVEGEIKTYDGFAFVVDDTLTWSSTVTVYGALAACKGYLYKGAMDTGHLPLDPSALIEPPVQLVPGIELRHTSGGNNSATSTNLVWIGYFGYKLGEVKAGIRFEVAA